MRFGINEWDTFDKGAEKEYLITNGLGSFSSGTIIGANTRKYHGILNASLVSPVKRYLLLSRVITEVEVSGQSYTMESTEYEDNKTMGHNHLRSFENLPIPTFKYGVKDVKIKKEIAMTYGKNESAVYYTVKTGLDPVKLKLKLHVNCRDHHEVTEAGDFSYEQNVDGNAIEFIENDKDIKFYVKGFGEYHQLNQWDSTEFLRIEDRRGQTCFDTSLIAGAFVIEIPSNTEISFGITASTEKELNEPQYVVENECKRRAQLIGDEKNELLQELLVSADQFIVNRESTKSKTIIAGYPWFTDWGRDTMIALPGLTLSTGRFEDAKDIMMTFFDYLDQGMIPNMFPDENTKPLYNTIDGTLWMFIAIKEYFDKTNDLETVKELYPKLKDIIQWHVKGTRYSIKMDDDGLLSGGDPTTQLTWMDVKVNGWVVTPRHGKAVEINALWYNAVKVMEQFSQLLSVEGDMFADIAQKVENNFTEAFWNESEQCLHDVIQDGAPVSKIRPNQIFAVSLPYSLLDEVKEKAVVDKVYKELYTPYGLRSLDKADEEYQGKYDGEILARDGAYHQGTVWGWLVGHFIDAYYKVYGPQSKELLIELLDCYKDHLRDGCIGGIAEIFYGDEPHFPRGCPTQAWSVSEVLRVYKKLLNS